MEGQRVSNLPGRNRKAKAELLDFTVTAWQRTVDVVTFGKAATTRTYRVVAWTKRVLAADPLAASKLAARLAKLKDAQWMDNKFNRGKPDFVLRVVDNTRLRAKGA